jgi:hypothetical protein
LKRKQQLERLASRKRSKKHDGKSGGEDAKSDEEDEEAAAAASLAALAQHAAAGEAADEPMPDAREQASKVFAVLGVQEPARGGPVFGARKQSISNLGERRLRDAAKCGVQLVEAVCRKVAPHDPAGFYSHLASSAQAQRSSIIGPSSQPSSAAQLQLVRGSLLARVQFCAFCSLAQPLRLPSPTACAAGRAGAQFGAQGRLA